MQEARRNGALVGLPGGHLIVAGGNKAHRSLAGVECLTLGDAAWKSLAPLPVPLCASGAVFTRGRVVLCGGEDKDGNILKTVHTFRPPQMPLVESADHGQWTVLQAETPDPVWTNCVCAFEKELYVFRE